MKYLAAPCCLVLGSCATVAGPDSVGATLSELYANAYHEFSCFHADIDHSNASGRRKSHRLQSLHERILSTGGRVATLLNDGNVEEISGRIDRDCGSIMWTSAPPLTSAYIRELEEEVENLEDCIAQMELDRSQEVCSI